MATKKSIKDTRPLAKKEAQAFLDLVGKARRKAWKISEDPRYTSYIKKTFKTIEKKLGNIRIDYCWGRMTNFEL